MCLFYEIYEKENGTAGAHCDCNAFKNASIKLKL